MIPKIFLIKSYIFQSFGPLSSWLEITLSIEKLSSCSSSSQLTYILTRWEKSRKQAGPFFHLSSCWSLHQVGMSKLSYRPSCSIDRTTMKNNSLNFCFHNLLPFHSFGWTIFWCVHRLIYSTGYFLLSVEQLSYWLIKTPIG